MEQIGGHHRRRWLTRLIQGISLSLLFAAAVTWAGAVYDQPVDRTITAGMAAPECAEVRAMPAGSLLLARLPDSDICRSFFLYRSSFTDAAADARSYAESVMQNRLGEFRQLIGYVWLLSIAAVSAAFTLVFAVRAGLGRHRGSIRQLDDEMQ